MLVRPYNGKLYLFNDTSYSRPLSKQQMSEVIKSDGYKSRLVNAINGKFPGPSIEAYELNAYRFNHCSLARYPSKRIS